MEQKSAAGGTGAPRTTGNHSPAMEPTERQALFTSFQPLVRRLTSRYGSDPELRQDLQGEIYCRFSTLLDAFDPGRGIPRQAYLVRTLTASVHTYTRGQWRRQNREVSLDAAVGTFPTHLEADPAPGPEEEVATRALLDALPAAIQRLPLRQRQVVVWTFYEGLSHAEIAEKLEVKPATARSLLRHAINNLRKQAELKAVGADADR